MATLPPLILSPPERHALAALVRSGTVEARVARRARAILLVADGHSVRVTGKQVGLAPRMVQHWKRAFLARRLEGLADAPRPGRPRAIPLSKEARILADTQRRPPAPLTHWSSRLMARRHGVSQSFIVRLWQRHGLKPHQLDYYVASPDPDFEAKAAVILGLYLNPPAHAVVLCIDEKSHIQALDRTQPALPLRPGRRERHSFEYLRRGTLSLYAALEVSSGRVRGRCVPRHTAAEFVRFLDATTRGYGRQEIHGIVDNLSAHKAPEVQAWLAKASPRPPALHTDVQLLAQPSGALVRQDRTRLHRAGHLLLDPRTSRGSSWPTSTGITRRPSLSSGPTRIRRGESVSLINDSDH